jgi:hypothetical protein
MYEIIPRGCKSPDTRDRLLYTEVTGSIRKELIAFGMGTTITLDRLKMRGYVSLLEIYSKIGLPSIRGTGSINFPTI